MGFIYSPKNTDDNQHLMNFGHLNSDFQYFVVDCHCHFKSPVCQGLLVKPEDTMNIFFIVYN